MTVRIYVRASTKDQDAERALDSLKEFASTIHGVTVEYVENESGTKLDRPVLNNLLTDAENGDTLLVESVDRLSRLKQEEFEVLKGRIKEKGLKLEAAQEEIKRNKDGVSKKHEAIERLKGVRNKLQNMLDALHKLR